VGADAESARHCSSSSTSWAERRAARLSALAATDQDRWPLAVEVHVAPLHGDQLRAAQGGYDEREQNELLGNDLSAFNQKTEYTERQVSSRMV